MPNGPISELSEKILLTLLRLNGVSTKTIGEQVLRVELNVESAQLLEQTETLTQLGFLIGTIVDGQKSFSLTSLGLAFLRQLQEDKLQELG